MKMLQVLVLSVNILPFYREYKPYRMKRIYLLIVALMVLASCEFNTSSSTSVSLTHSGTVVFTDDMEGIKSITPKGFLYYDENGDKLSVTCDAQGNISYQLNDNDKTSQPRGDVAKMLKNAVGFCIKTGELKNKPYVLTEKPTP